MSRQTPVYIFEHLEHIITHNSQKVETSQCLPSNEWISRAQY